MAALTCLVLVVGGLALAIRTAVTHGPLVVCVLGGVAFVIGVVGSNRIWED